MKKSNGHKKRKKIDLKYFFIKLFLRQKKGEKRHAQEKNSFNFN